MQFLSDILIKGKAFIDNIVSTDGSPFKFLVRDTVTGEIKEKDATMPYSQGSQHKVNVADGSGGWKETNLKVDGELIRHKDGSSGIEITHNGEDDNVELEFDRLIINSDDPRIIPKSGYFGAPWQPTDTNHLVNKKYVDNEILKAVPPEPWTMLTLSSPPNNQDTDTISLDATSKNIIRLTVQFDGSEGDKYLSAQIIADASVYKHTNIMLISDLKIVSYTGVKYKFSPNKPLVSNLPDNELTVKANMDGIAWTGSFNIQNNTNINETAMEISNITVRYKIDITDFTTI